MWRFGYGAQLRPICSLVLDDEAEAEAVGAEKSPRKVGLFVLTLMVGVVNALGFVFLYLRFHTPALRQGNEQGLEM
jgi:hypothetical protein